MKKIPLERAFGTTPDSVQKVIEASLLEARRRDNTMKKRLPVALIAAVLALALIGCAAIAATNLGGIMQFFQRPGNDAEAPIINEDIQEFIEPIAISHEGDSVKVYVQEILYDANTGTVALSWTMEAKEKGEMLYVRCIPRSSEGFIVGAHMKYVTDFILEDFAESVFSGELPENATDVILPFEVIRLNADVQRVRSDDFQTEEAFDEHLRALVESGVLPMAGDGAFELYFMPGKTDAEKLLSTGLCELVDSFTMTIPLDEKNSVSKTRTLTGENTFSLEDGEIEIHALTVTPASMSLSMDYIANAGTATDIYIDINPPGVESWCAGVSSVHEDPVTLSDGRAKISITLKANELLVFPDELEMRILYYDEDWNVSHASEKIVLSLSE